MMRKAVILFCVFLFSSQCLPQSDGLQITYMRNLDFGNIIPGIKKTIYENEPDAGKFILKSNGNRFVVNVSFNLAGGINSSAGVLPVVFTASSSINPNDDQPGTPFNPYSGTTLQFDDKTREYFIRIGGTINPPAVQKAGEYNSQIIIVLTTVSN
ncbi:MAG: DUF4402 domain-containing protein [Ignavibacteria bacterium]